MYPSPRAPPSCVCHIREQALPRPWNSGSVYQWFPGVPRFPACCKDGLHEIAECDVRTSRTARRCLCRLRNPWRHGSRRRPCQCSARASRTPPFNRWWLPSEWLIVAHAHDIRGCRGRAWTRTPVWRPVVVLDAVIWGARGGAARSFGRRAWLAEHSRSWQSVYRGGEGDHLRDCTT